MKLEERLRKRLEEKGHTNPDKALEQLGIEVEQKGHPRFSDEGFMWYGTMITDPTKDESGRFTVDPRVYYATHYEQWLIWKARRDGDTETVTHESEIEQKQTATIFHSPEFQQAMANLGAAWRGWVQGPASEMLTPIEIEEVGATIVERVRRIIRI